MNADTEAPPRITSLDEYQQLSMSTAAITPFPGPALITTALGLTGEAGEFADIVKKWYAQEHELDRETLINELGDILWYVARGASALDINLSDIANANRAKLVARYPEGFSSEKSINRE